MPKRTDISSILIIGAGPIVIGQACEFDYSGTQACKALRAEGYRIVLVNSNPATIMTDPGSRGRDLCRADHAGDRRQDHREGAARCAPADHGRPDRAQHRAVPQEDGRAGEVRRRDDRGHRRGDRQGRGPPALPRGDAQDRARDAEIAPRQRLGPEEGRPREAPCRDRRDRGRGPASRATRSAASPPSSSSGRRARRTGASATRSTPSARP